MDETRCRFCGKTFTNPGNECDACWEIDHRIRDASGFARLLGVLATQGRSAFTEDQIRSLLEAVTFAWNTCNDTVISESSETLALKAQRQAKDFDALRDLLQMHLNSIKMLKEAPASYPVPPRG